MELNYIFKTWTIICIFFACNTGYAIYSLDDFPFFDTCPFMHNDGYAADINRLHDIIKNQLETKIEGNRLCRGPFNTIQQNLNSINDIFRHNRNPSLFEEVSDGVLSQQLLQLELDLLLQKKGSSEYLNLAAEIRSIENQIYQTEINKVFNRDYFKESRDNAALTKTFNHMNQVIKTMSNLPPQCIDTLGGWQQVVPTLLNSVSSLSGLSGMAYSAIIGAGVQLISGLTILLQDLGAKRALKNLIRQKNNKILACTYFSLKNTACQFKQALDFSNNEEEIKRIITQKYKNKDTAIFDEFFLLLEHSRDFEQVFFDVAAMGSAISFDVDLINKYFNARRTTPETILDPEDIGPPPEEDDEAPDANRRRQEWLIAVKARGIGFQEKNFLGIVPLKEQVQQALLDIAQKLADIQSVEYVLRGRRSFIDLKHELDTNPNLLDKVKKYKNFFKRILNQKVVPTKKIGIIAAANRILDELQKFLEVRYDIPRIPMDIAHDIQREIAFPVDQAIYDYQEEVNEKGRLLFSVMAEGAVAQISRQSVLTVGKTVQDRVNRVFRLLEEEFLNQELQIVENDIRRPIKYSEYKRDRSILINVALNYQTFSGHGKTFRSEDINVALDAIEKGFSKEIRHMVQESLKTKSKYYPSLNGETASHLCSLFSQTLSKSKYLSPRMYKIYQKCKTNFTELKLLKIISPTEMTIDWKDPCFYYNYNRLLSTQQSLYRRMLKLGYKIEDEKIIHHEKNLFH